MACNDRRRTLEIRELMKGFFATLLVVCGLIAAAYFLYDPYIKPYLSGGKGEMFSGEDAVMDEKEASDVVAKPTVPVSYKEEPNDPKEVEKSEIDQLLEKRYPMPEILPLGVIVNNWANVPPRAFPAEVTAKVPLKFSLIVDGQEIGSSEVAPGTPLKPIQLVGDQLTIGSPGNVAMTKVLPLDQTDFKERVTARYEEFVEMKTNEVETLRARVKQSVQSDPTKMAALQGKAPATPSGDARFAPVKASLTNGDAPSVTLEEATSFAWNGSETITDGDFAGTYDTVTVNFEVKTIFGKFPAEYKALLRGGKVVAWIDPFTEERI